jgi:hypothetical protein
MMSVVALLILGWLGYVVCNKDEPNKRVSDDPLIWSPRSRLK